VSHVQQIFLCGMSQRLNFDCALLQSYIVHWEKLYAGKNFLYINFPDTATVTTTTTTAINTATTTTTTEVFELHFDELEFSAGSLESLQVTILCSSLHSCLCFTVLVSVFKYRLIINFLYISINTYINKYIYIHTHTERYESACMQLLMQFPKVMN